VRPTATADAAVFVAGETQLLYVDVVHQYKQVVVAPATRKKRLLLDKYFQMQIFRVQINYAEFQPENTCCWKNRKRKKIRV